MKRSPTTLEREALGYLDLEATTAGELGAWLRNTGRMSTSGRVSSAWGGGDYTAQMLLGRMRKQGWCRTRQLRGPGASIWEATAAGRKAMHREARS